MIDLFNPGDKNWFYQKFHKLDQRYPTMKAAVNLFIQRGGEVIVETGVQRAIDDWGAGMSTTIFAEVCQKYQKRLYTVDNNEEHLNRAKEYTQPYASFIKYYLDDSVKFLRQFNQKIDLLYLDSLDYPMRFDYKTDFEFEKAIEDCQIHCLNEVKMAHRRFYHGSICLLDDWNFPRGGKGKLAVDWLLSQGYHIILDGQQILLSK